MNRRKMTIEIDATTTKELVYALKQVESRIITCGDGFHRFQTMGTHVEMNLQTYGEELEYRVEEINGKMCQIFRSKL